MRSIIFFALSLLILISCKNSDHKTQYDTWKTYKGSNESLQYSSLTQIDTSNVSQLQVAWTYHTGDADTVNHSQIQCNPIVIDGILFGTTPKMKLFAVDATNGKEKWIFDPAVAMGENKRSFFGMNNVRGIAYWTDGKEDKRLFYSVGAYLYCINASTGKPVSTFGEDGHIDLHNGLDRDVKDLFVISTSPGTVYKNMIIMGTRVDEGPNAAPGHIRAFDVLTGERKWIFHTIPQPGEFGYDTWEDSLAYKHIGGANNWSGMSLDEKRGIVFIPIGSASFDFYGGMRKGQNLFANCLLALDANTGKRIWHFQSVHHDVWDRDFPAAPALVTINREGKKIDAVAQTSKTGFVYVFERETGKSLFPIEERKVPVETALKGEKLFPTQPYPLLPKPYVRQLFTENEINNLVPDSTYQDIKKRWASYKKEHLFTAPSKEGTIMFPGYDGGGEWGGPSVDPETGILYVNANEMAWVLTLVDVNNDQKGKENNLDAGKRLYQKNCLTCHGPDRKGTGNNPSLIDIHKKYDKKAFLDLVSTGRRMMPAFKQLAEEEKEAIMSFVLDMKEEQNKSFITSGQKKDEYLNLPYTSTGYNKFLTKDRYPAIKPPWGTLTAIDLNTGEHVWQTPLGDYPEISKKTGKPTGTENYGGPVVTAGGLVFIAAAKDGKFRAFNKKTGKVVWEYDLPAPGFASPSIYQVNGKQYIVIACGGGKLGTKSGDSYVAFALGNK